MDTRSTHNPISTTPPALAEPPRVRIRRSFSSDEERREARRVRERANYLANKDLQKARNARYLQANPQRVKAPQKKREYTPARALAMRLSEQKLRIAHPWRSLLREVQKRTKKTGVAFDLTNEWAGQRWTGRCEITDIAFEANKNGERSILSASVDRIDPKKGYTQGNCRFILLSVNMMKGVGTDEQVVRVAQAIVEHKTFRAS